MKWCDFTFWRFHHWAKLNGLTILFDHPNETSFAVLLFACATDGTKRLVIRLAHLQNSAKILVLGLHLCSRIWVCIMIGLLKKAIVDLPIRLKGNSKLSWGLGTRISVFLPTHLRLQHRLCFCISLLFYYAAQGGSDFLKSMTTQMKPL